jgi:hypothetical protein
MRQLGRCWHCGKEQPINIRTDKPFVECKARRQLKRKCDKKRTLFLSDGYVANLINMKLKDNIPIELLELKREQLRLFRISRGGKRYEKYV